MAAPVIADTWTSNATAAGSITFGGLSGIAAGDLLVAWLLSSDSTVTFSPPGAGATWTAAFARDLSQRAFWAIAAGGEASLTFGLSNGTKFGVGVLYRITGHDPTAPIEVVAIGADPSVNNPPTPQVTTLGADRLVLTAKGTTFGTSSVGTPSGWTAGPIVVHATNAAPELSLASKTQAAAGATGTSTWATSTRQWSLATVAIKPAAGGGGPLIAAIRRHRTQRLLMVE